MTIRIFEAAFDPWQEMTRFQNEHTELAGKSGASAVFVGAMRDFNEGDEVTSMTLEHYPGMTERQLEVIAEQAVSKWSLDEIFIAHRVGELTPGDPIVLVAVFSAHRAAAFEACRHVMEQLKSTAPFWKKETLNDGERWVANNTPGYTEEH